MTTRPKAVFLPAEFLRWLNAIVDRCGPSDLGKTVAPLALLGGILACGSTSPASPITPPPTDAVPPLESVAFEALGSGKIAFERIGAGGAYTAVYVIDATARSTSHAFDRVVTFGPALSPDGRRIAFTRRFDDATRFDVNIANVDGTGILRVTHFSENEGPPSWTPDGAKIIVAAGEGTLVFNVFSQSAVASPVDLTQLTHFTLAPGESPVCPYMIGGDVGVAVSSQGLLAFACAAGREMDVLSSNGALSKRYVPSIDNRVFSPSWSPDGTRLAFIEMKADATADNSVIIKVMNADATGVTTVVTVPPSTAFSGGDWVGTNNRSLCWMPDGSRLVFNVADGTRVGHIWVVRVDGTGLAKLTSAPQAFDRSVSCSR